MANEFNPEVYTKIKAVHESLQDGAFPKLPTAMSLVSDQAKESGVTALVKSCAAAEEEGVPAIMKSFQELMDVVEKYLDSTKSMYDALGVEA